MAKVKILIQGYAKEENGVEKASSSATLIYDNNLKIIVDPGMDKKALLDSLIKEGLETQDINYVVVTHTHLDHCLLAGIFDNAKILDDTAIHSLDGKMEDHDGIIPETNIKIIQTPGHDQFHCSVVVDTEDMGKVVIAGDVFWWEDDEEQEKDESGLINHQDPYAKNETQLKESRKKVLELADYIVPGHGPIYKVKK